MRLPGAGLSDDAGIVPILVRDEPEEDDEEDEDEKPDNDRDDDEDTGYSERAAFYVFGEDEAIFGSQMM
jgi:hypothetical protein